MCLGKQCLTISSTPIFLAILFETAILRNYIVISSTSTTTGNSKQQKAKWCNMYNKGHHDTML